MSAVTETNLEEYKSYQGIPIRNIWMLLLYASELFSKVEHERIKQGREETPDDILEVIAEMLTFFVRERIVRGLTRSSIAVQADLQRVRGSISHLRTERQQLLSRGLVACRFDEPTLNTARNRLIRCALEKGAKTLESSVLRKKCRDYASLLFRMGVTGSLPDRTTLSKEVYGINDKEDRYAVAAARLLLDGLMPDDRTGNHPLLSPKHIKKWLRRLFENAVRGMYLAASPKEWHVAKGNVAQKWPVDIITEDIEKYMPNMELDIVLTNHAQRRRIIIDTKFTSLFKNGWFREKTLSSAYIYQMYAYLRSQEEIGKNELEVQMNRTATGILLHPAIEDSEYHEVSMQGHKIVFATVDLTEEPKKIRENVLGLLQ